MIRGARVKSPVVDGCSFNCEEDDVATMRAARMYGYREPRRIDEIPVPLWN
jgi:hypothetical protein